MSDVGIILVVFITCCAPIIILALLYYHKKKMEHTQIMTAIEKGTPLSELKPVKKEENQATCFSSIMGRCFLPSKKPITKTSLAPFLPFIFVTGAAHGLPRGQRERGSKRSLALAGTRLS